MRLEFLLNIFSCSKKQLLYREKKKSGRNLLFCAFMGKMKVENNRFIPLIGVHLNDLKEFVSRRRKCWLEI